jgi:hypothetical protein
MTPPPVNIERQLGTLLKNSLVTVYPDKFATQEQVL